MVSRLHRNTPLWPAGHLPHKGGDQLGAPACLDKAQQREKWRLKKLGHVRQVCARSQPLVISLLGGEMAGRPEGGWHGKAPAICGAIP